MTTDTRRSLCDWVVDNYFDMLVEAVQGTDDTGIEHGFTIIGYPGDVDTTAMVTGSERSIDLATSTTSAYRPIRVGVHTHPSGSIVASDRDWKSFITQSGQYKPGAPFPKGWRRGSVILGRRMGDEGQFGMKALEITEVGAGLSVQEQRDWVDDAFEALDDPMVGGLGSSETIAEAMGPNVRVCTRTVEY